MQRLQAAAIQPHKSGEIRKTARGYEYYSDSANAWFVCKDQIVAYDLYHKQLNQGGTRRSAQIATPANTEVGNTKTDNGLSYVWNGNNWVPKWINTSIKSLLED